MSRRIPAGLLAVIAGGCILPDDVPIEKRQGGAEEVDPEDTSVDEDSAVDTGEVDPVDPPNEELRGIWITRWSWDSPDEIEAMMADIAASGFNTVFFQVRGEFDAYYASGVEPWAERLTGVLGRDPGWDPLQTAIEAGHAQGLAVHAYMNTFPFWRGSEPPGDATPQHAYRVHPQWVVADESGTPMALNSSYVFASPGNPSVRAHVEAVAADIADNYEVDGIHLDYIRYPGPQYSHDATSVARYDALGGGQDRGDWQRDQVVDTVFRVREAVDVPVTAAVWGIHTNEWGWSGVSQGNVDFYQDSFAMLDQGALDGSIPMIYWPVGETEGDRLDFRVLVREHVAHRGARHVYAGMGGENVTLEQVEACIAVAREEGAQGVVLFDYSLFATDLIRLRESVFEEDAIPPEMQWR